MSLGHLWNKSCGCILNERFRFQSNSTNHQGITILVTPECSGSGPQSLRWRLFDLLWLLCSFIQSGRENHLETQMLGFHKPCPKKYWMFLWPTYYGFFCTCVFRWVGEKEQLLWTGSSNFRFNCVVVLFLGSRRLLDTEDELSDIQSDAVPSEVRDWLASTFTRQMGMMLRRSEEKPRFKSIVHAVQAGIFVER